MKYEEIEELYNKLDTYSNSIGTGPEQDELLNKLTKLSELLDTFDSQSIEQKSKELLGDLENKELDTLIKDSIEEVNNISSSIENVTKIVSGLDKIINKLNRFS